MAVVLSSFSCASEELDSTKNEHDVAEVHSVQKCVPQEQIGFLGLITAGNVADVEIGKSISTILLSNDRYEVQTVKQITPDNSKLNTINHLFYDGNEVMILESGDDNKVKVISIISPSYYLENCLHVGSAFVDVLDKYELLDIMLNFDDGMVYIQPVNNPEFRFMLMGNDILDVDKIDKASGRVAIDNIKKEGVINSIIIS